jgi:cytidine deaminase
MNQLGALLAAAAAAQANAYAPYSDYRVGAALEDSAGRIFSGCNLENASYGLSICAERNAIAAAVTAGLKPGGLSALLLLAGGGTPAVPCGACLQVIAEFAAEDARIICAAEGGDTREYLLADLLPRRFRLER